VERTETSPLVVEEKPQAAHPCDRCGSEAEGGPVYNYMCGDKLSTSSTPTGGGMVRYTTTYGNLEPITVLLCDNCYRVESQATWLRLLLGGLAGIVLFAFFMLAAAYTASQGLRDFTVMAMMVGCFLAMAVSAGLTLLLVKERTSFIEQSSQVGSQVARGMLAGFLDNDLIKYARRKASYRGHSFVWTMSAYSTLKRTH
jgi:hypothetical protein